MPSTSGLLPDTTSAQSKIAPPSNPPKPDGRTAILTDAELGPNPVTLPEGEQVRRPVFAPNKELYTRVPGEHSPDWFESEEIVG